MSSGCLIQSEQNTCVWAAIMLIRATSAVNLFITDFVARHTGSIITSELSIRAGGWAGERQSGWKTGRRVTMTQFPTNENSGATNGGTCRFQKVFGLSAHLHSGIWLHRCSLDIAERHRRPLRWECTPQTDSNGSLPVCTHCWSLQ